MDSILVKETALAVGQVLTANFCQNV